MPSNQPFAPFILRDGPYGLTALGERESGGSETPFLTVKTTGFGAGTTVLPQAVKRHDN
ncbi:MAG: hypothetical protein JXQ75_18400 [Phycisphaerae bacterium]|nr:hypothetical protein [Phycisphaerae bacterium]